MTKTVLGWLLQTPGALEALANHNCGWFYRKSASDYSSIPDSPIAYWVSPSGKKAFTLNPKLSSVASALSGITTGDNEKYIHLWWECDISRFCVEAGSIDDIEGCKAWFPCSKGGEFKKWYGNREQAIRFDMEAQSQMRSLPGYRPVNMDKQFLEGITWTGISSGMFACRLSPRGAMFDHKGPTCFPIENEKKWYLLGLLNSSVAMVFLKMLSPTLDFRERAVGNIPFASASKNQSEKVESLVRGAYLETRSAWDSSEISWDFKRHPLL